jgi:hypothetical protein
MAGKVGLTKSDVQLSVSHKGRTINSVAGAERIREYMTRHALIQGEFAEASHIAERTLGDLLRTGSASKQTWAKAAHKMGTTREELVKP